MTRGDPGSRRVPPITRHHAFVAVGLVLLGGAVAIAGLLPVPGLERGSSPGAAVGPVSSSFGAPTPAPGSESASISQRFGMAAHLMWRDLPTAMDQLDQMREAGLGVIRFDVSWRNMEPDPGQYRDLEKLDALLDSIRVHGMRPIVTVIESPAWSNGDRDRWVPPDDPADYGRFVALLATRYAEYGVAWEIWNEPNDPRFWRPAPDAVAYTKLLQAAAAAIRSAAPGSTILGGSILFADTRFLQTMYDAGAAGTFDGLAVHPYAGVAAPSERGDGFHSFVAGMDELHRVALERDDADPRLWVTEVGWPAADESGEPVDRGRFFAEAVELIRARPFVEVMAAYTVSSSDDPAFGLLGEGGPAAAWDRYAAAVREESRHSPQP